jgi:hypothetical protein
MAKIKADATTKNNDTDSKQSGAGAEVTALAESLQAYACATRQFLGKDLTDVAQITEKTIGDADCDRTLKKCMAGLDEQWFYSIILTANKIFEEVPGAKTGKNYKFYRGGKFVDSIYDEWRRFKKGSGITGDDKWNPADIWMVKKTHKHEYGFPTLKDYNAYMYNMFAKTECIGISLKKLEKGGQPHSKIFNSGKPLTASYTGVKLGANMFDSKDIYIQYTSENKAGEVQLRNFSSRPVPSSWQGEIKGKAAAGGKIGGGVIFEGAMDIGMKKADLSLPSETPINKPTDADFKAFATAFKTLSGSKEKIDKLVLEAKAGHRKDKTWWMSKYIGIMLVDTVIKKKKMNDLCSFIFQYASSATKNSCIFIKYS